VCERERILTLTVLGISISTLETYPSLNPIAPICKSASIIHFFPLSESSALNQPFSAKSAKDLGVVVEEEGSCEAERTFEEEVKGRNWW
jgi:hypothetical protein